MTTPDERKLRVGHAERDRAVAELRDAAGDGRLTLDELDARIESAMAARTGDDLRVILADLVAPATLASMLGVQGVPVPGAPGSSWDNPVVFSAQWEDVVRAGSWIVPAFLEANAIVSSVKLVFTDARVTSPVVDISVNGGMGNVVIVVPEGFGVDVTHMKAGMGSIRSGVAQRPQPGGAQLVLRGNVKMGALKVRHPNWLDSWQRQRLQARGGGPVIKN